MTLREEIAQMSETRMVTMPKLDVQCRYGGGTVKNRQEIVRFIESVLDKSIGNRKKLAVDIYEDIFQAGYDVGAEEFGNKED